MTLPWCEKKRYLGIEPTGKIMMFVHWLKPPTRSKSYHAKITMSTYPEFPKQLSTCPIHPQPIRLQLPRIYERFAHSRATTMGLLSILKKMKKERCPNKPRCLYFKWPHILVVFALSQSVAPVAMDLVLVVSTCCTWTFTL